MKKEQQDFYEEIQMAKDKVNIQCECCQCIWELKDDANITAKLIQCPICNDLDLRKWIKEEEFVVVEIVRNQ